MTVSDKSTMSGVDALASLPRLGIGLLYNPALPDFVRANLETFDYIAVIPDMLWVDRGAGQSPRYEEIESWVEVLDWVSEHRPIVSHNIGLSIGSADLFNSDYLEQIGRFHSRYKFPWHSDHLSFMQISTRGGNSHNTGLAIPVPYDKEMLELIAGRIGQIQKAVPIPFLVENNVYYINIPEQEMTEQQFLNQLTVDADCNLLLDLHNLYANARNHNFDAIEFLDQLELNRVVEVHIAGGDEFAGMYTDSHAGPCPEPVWELLEYVIPRSPNLCGVTFEFNASYYPLMEADGVRSQLERARAAWERYH